jgi:exodeoxyribonuclease-3
MPTKKIVTWNIRHGGGLRAQLAAETLLGFEADLLVITEYRSGTAGTLVKASLDGAGYRLAGPQSPLRMNSLLVAAKTVILDSSRLTDRVSEPHRLWRVELGWITICATYFPQGRLKAPYWEAVLAAARSATGIALFIGDFNTGTNDLDKSPAGTSFACAEYMERVREVGLVDLWRSRYPDQRDFTWFSAAGNGFRIDHAFAVRELDRRVTGCRILADPRTSGVSDHSALLVEVDA